MTLEFTAGEIAAYRSLIARARAEVYDLAAGREWRQSIPAMPDDSDVIFDDAINGLQELLDRVVTLIPPTPENQNLWDAKIIISATGKQATEFKCTFVLANLIPRILGFVSFGESTMILLNSSSASLDSSNLVVPKATADEIMDYISHNHQRLVGGLE